MTVLSAIASSPGSRLPVWRKFIACKRRRTTWLLQALGDGPGSAREEYRARGAGKCASGGDDLLDQHQQRDRGDPQHVHHPAHEEEDRKSTRLNSSHVKISYAVFCLKKKTT